MQFVYTAALFTQFFMYLLLCLYKYHSELRAEEEPTITGKGHYPATSRFKKG